MEQQPPLSLHTHQPLPQPRARENTHACALRLQPPPSPPPPPPSPTTAKPSADNAWATRKHLSTLSFTASTAEPSAKNKHYSPLLAALPPAADGDNTAIIPIPHQRAFFTQTAQHKLAAFLHACFDYWKTHTTPLPSCLVPLAPSICAPSPQYWGVAAPRGVNRTEPNPGDNGCDGLT